MPRRKKLPVAVKLRAVNQVGRVIGQDHGRAVLTDADVDRMRLIHEEFDVGDPQHTGYRKLARMFDCSVSLVKRICRYEIRHQQVTRYIRGT